MIRVAIGRDGTLQLGQAAAAIGFRPGALVNVIVTRSGSLILAIDDTPELDLSCRRLDGGRAPLALRGSKAG